jgi:uncharacterized protein with HEPN domain
MDRAAAYVEDMVQAGTELAGLAQGFTAAQFVSDRLRCLAAEKLFINLGEAASRIRPHQAAAIEGVAWRHLIGLRNILAHQYEEIEHEVLFHTIRVDLPPMVTALEAWLRSRRAS